MQTETNTKTNAKTEKPKKVTELDIASEHKALVKQVETTIAAMARKDVEALFARGRELARVKSVLPEKTFGKWVTQRCGYTPRLARLQVAAYENLPLYHERLVHAKVAPTIVYVLSSAPHEKVEEVVAAVEGGVRLTVGKVKVMIKPEGGVEESKNVPLGGAVGLRRAGEARMKADVDLFTKLAKRSLKAVEQLVVDISRGKHVTKTKLAAAVEADCQKGGILIGGVISPRGSSAPLSVEWEKARQVIARLGDSPRYPGREEFAAWVVDQALPALRFVVHGTALSGDGSGTEEGRGTSVADHGDSQTTANASGEPPIIDTHEPDAVELPKHRLRLVSAPVLAPDDSIVSLAETDDEMMTAE